MSARFVAARLLLLLVAIAIAGCRAPSPVERYECWLADGQREKVAEYRGYLRAQGLADLPPMQQILRSGRRWRQCGAAEFALPPKPMWPETARTLRLIADLRAAGLLEGVEITSGYRNAALNRCEGGSSRSRHMSGGAYDFDLARDADTQALCDFWRRRGPASGFGLGFYDARHLHIDTAGFRTWGEDYTYRTSQCVPGARLKHDANQPDAP
ncbi:D-Ala-D-Ala carboxypeptidase family metallohydrolase [Lysobacter capsici]|uniref:D-Ala-D-Ala carboxypeptidase family metallohydrolase n=1 Tax=Lysobacter capsici TaxID=435897 RepID=UPI000A83667A|nr:D-Ala-D-Ala carboxypeptidase family metallohydrolase [Lysobacter capsici]